MKKNLSLLILLALCFFYEIQVTGQTSAPSPSPQRGNVQPADDEDVVRITTNLIQVDVVVTDKKGKPVPNLKPEDFEILENNKKQKITTFSFVTSESQPVADAPKTKPDKNALPTPSVKLRPEQVRRTIALVVDDLGLSFTSINYVNKALKKFVDEQMEQGDLVAIVRTSSGVGALQQFTSDKQQLYAAIDKVKYTSLGRGGISAFAPIEDNGDMDTSGIDNLNEFRDEIYSVGTLGAINYVVRGMRELPGRKAIMLFSDGFVISDPSDPYRTQRVRENLLRLVDLSNRAGVVIYTIDARGLVYTGPTAADRITSASQLSGIMSMRNAILFNTQEGLNYLARETGGIAFRNSNDIAGGVRKMMDDQKSYYLIGYQPDSDTFDPKKNRFNKLTVKVKVKGAKVRYRSGFFGIKDEDIKPVEQTAGQKVVSALLSPFTSGAVALRLTPLFGNTEKFGSYIRTLIHVNGRDITFNKEADGSYKADFDVLVVTFADNGVPIDQLGKSYTLRVNEKWHQRVLQNGFVYHLNLPIKKAGAYQMRVALLDGATSNIGSANQFIQIPDVKKDRLTLSSIVLTKYEPEEKKPAKNEDEDSGVTEEADPLTQAARRQFHPGDAILFGYSIYNAKSDKQTKQTQLKTQVRLLRDGKPIYVGEETPFEPNAQGDMKRLPFGRVLQLTKDLPLGDYVLQVIVTDSLAKEKYQKTTRWIDFEIVK